MDEIQRIAPVAKAVAVGAGCVPGDDSLGSASPRHGQAGRRRSSPRSARQIDVAGFSVFWDRCVSLACRPPARGPKRMRSSNDRGAAGGAADRSFAVEIPMG
ncbi:hypothetical protein MB901379_01062 [Mycobacterium basiliense]|uniref:Uncharacterized protein n=1 Tax=Mycobacterium basiliense TaxID=2094119 RepID=A0A3S4DRP7_9MYCO|nr:hypothetical protein MB901379_01062 [Mycobacterium basiliense]